MKLDSRILCTRVGYLRWAPNITGENIFMPQDMPRPGLEPGPVNAKSCTLPRSCKSQFLPQGRTSVLYNYTR